MTVDAEWAGGRLTAAALRTSLAGRHRIRVPAGTSLATITADDLVVSFRQETDGVELRLEPGRTYAFWLNSDQFKNFRDSEGRPAVPYLLIFETKQEGKEKQ